MINFTKNLLDISLEVRIAVKLFEQQTKFITARHDFPRINERLYRVWHAFVRYRGPRVHPTSTENVLNKNAQCLWFSVRFLAHFLLERSREFGPCFISVLLECGFPLLLNESALSVALSTLVFRQEKPLLWDKYF